MEFFCQDEIFRLVPWAATFFAGFAAMLAIARTLSEALFAIARFCGQVDSSVAKWAGKTSWELGRFCGAIGWSHSKRFIDAKYVERPAKSKS